MSYDQLRKEAFSSVSSNQSSCFCLIFKIESQVILKQLKLNKIPRSISNRTELNICKMGLGTVLLQPTMGPPAPSPSPPPQPVLATTTEPDPPAQPPAYDNYFDDPSYPRRVPMVRTNVFTKIQMYIYDHLWNDRSKQLFFTYYYYCLFKTLCRVYFLQTNSSTAL